MLTPYFFYTVSWSSLSSMDCSVNVQSSGFLQESNTICKYSFNLSQNNLKTMDTTTLGSSLPLLMNGWMGG